MKTLTVVEIVEYAIRIEEESFRFYRSAGKFLVDEDASYDRLYGMSTMDETVRKTFQLLRNQEQEHVQCVQKLISGSG